MDPTIEYLWAAGYDLPPETIILKGRDAGKTTQSIVLLPTPRRGKKAARAKRQKVNQ